jgi:signal transduction histidine kinase
MQEMLDALRDYTQCAILTRQDEAVIRADAALEAARSNLVMQLNAAQANVTAGPLPRVRYVSAHLIQLFQNLLSNALKYRRDEPLTIRIECRTEPDEYVFSVGDNGIGIAPEYHDRVFGVFKRLHGRNVPGTGIGLAICRRIVQNHGGHMWLESVPGQGSIFFFTIPR